MKIIVDKLSESPMECYFWKIKNFNNGMDNVGVCGLPNPIWTPCLAEEEGGCPYLKVMEENNG